MGLVLGSSGKGKPVGVVEVVDGGAADASGKIAKQDQITSVGGKEVSASSVGSVRTRGLVSVGVWL